MVVRIELILYREINDLHYEEIAVDTKTCKNLSQKLIFPVGILYSQGINERLSFN